MNPDHTLDASGLACPLPIVKTKKALATMAPGQLLRVIGTDPGTMDDMPALAEAGGHTLLSAAREGEQFVYLIRKG